MYSEMPTALRLVYSEDILHRLCSGGVRTTIALHC